MADNKKPKKPKLSDIDKPLPPPKKKPKDYDRPRPEQRIGGPGD